jgi:glycosyltransferase involved in cell wall biosynthesis
MAERATPSILLPYLTIPSFIQQDLAILEPHYRIIRADCRTNRGILRAVNQLAETDLLFCWFGSLRYLPIVAAARLRKQPICIVTGGYDVASLPSIGYGTMARPATRIPGRWLFAQADAVVPFSDSAGEEARINAAVDPARLTVIPLGYEPVPGPVLPREPFVLCVSNVDHSTLVRKGLLDLARLATRMPDVRFVLAGGGTDSALARLSQDRPANLELAGRVPDAELDRLFRTASAYIQPSYHEGFGSAVAEAMLRDTVPVVSRSFSLPEVVGDCGLYADPGDLATFDRQLRAVLGGSFHPAEPPHQRVFRLFPLERRRRDLLSLMRRLLGR